MSFASFAAPALVASKAKQTSAVIFLHGLGDQGMVYGDDS